MIFPGQNIEQNTAPGKKTQKPTIAERYKACQILESLEGADEIDTQPLIVGILSKGFQNATD